MGQKNEIRRIAHFKKRVEKTVCKFPGITKSGVPLVNPFLRIGVGYNRFESQFGEIQVPEGPHLADQLFKGAPPEEPEDE